MERTEREYRQAEGYCLTAMHSLRRFDSEEAVRCLEAAIHTIKQEQQRAAREERLKFRDTRPAPPPTPINYDDF